MKFHDDPRVCAPATGELVCIQCRRTFVPAGLDEATRSACNACLSPIGRRDHRASEACEQVSREPVLKPAKSAPRAFTKTDLSLIAKVHGFMAAPQLLMVLNERMWADLGHDAPPYTVQQLHDAIQQLQQAQATVGWSNVRRLLAQARSEGVMQQVNDQVIDDFAVVFSLTAKQVLHLKDIFATGGPR